MEDLYRNVVTVGVIGNYGLTGGRGGGRNPKNYRSPENEYFNGICALVVREVFLVRVRNSI